MELLKPQRLPKKFEPSELNPYIIKVQSHSQVLKDLGELWPRFQTGKSIVDLGCGNGHFLQDYLKQHSEMKGIGVERRYKRIFKTAEKLLGSESFVIRWDIPDFVDQSPRQLWDEVWLQFPDPWPKDRHAKHRMVSIKLFYGIYRMLKPGGRFCFRSDCLRYWEFLQTANKRAGLFPIVRSLQADLFDEKPLSLYKKKFQENSIPLYSLELRK